MSEPVFKAWCITPPDDNWIYGPEDWKHGRQRVVTCRWCGVTGLDLRRFVPLQRHVCSRDPKEEYWRARRAGMPASGRHG